VSSQPYSKHSSQQTDRPTYLRASTVERGKEQRVLGGLEGDLVVGASEATVRVLQRREGGEQAAVKRCLYRTQWHNNDDDDAYRTATEGA